MALWWGKEAIFTDMPEFALFQCTVNLHNLKKKCRLPLTLEAINFGLGLMAKISLSVSKVYTQTHAHIHFTALWTLSGITRVSQYQNQSEFY